MKHLASFVLVFSLASPGVASANLKVATLHPLLSDLARNVGGEKVEVVSLLKAGGDPHEFSPSPGDMTRIKDARLILASGKDLEPYLVRLGDNLAPGQEIFEVGRKIPSLRVEVGELFLCCPSHSQGGVDPHWWHGIGNMGRAARYLAEEFGRVDPPNKEAYLANAKAYGERLAKLKQWAEETLAPVPRADRELATSHAAFTYFCKEFGFRAIPVQGLNRESDPSPSYLAETLKVLKEANVRAVFPEQLANPKILEAMVAATGIKIGETLISDGTGSRGEETFEGMIRWNVERISRALQ
jgi:zinc/manganese transport system substrate-binding protein